MPGRNRQFGQDYPPGMIEKAAAVSNSAVIFDNGPKNAVCDLG